MKSITALLVAFLLIGLFAPRYTKRVRLLLIAIIVGIVAYITLSASLQ